LINQLSAIRISALELAKQLILRKLGFQAFAEALVIE